MFWLLACYSGKFVAKFSLVTQNGWNCQMSVWIQAACVFAVDLMQQRHRALPHLVCALELTWVPLTGVISSDVCIQFIFKSLCIFSCAAVWKNGRVEVCPNEQGNRITPSYIAWTREGERVVGDAAKNQAASNPSNTVFDVKRLIGRKYTDDAVQKDAKHLPFKSNNCWYRLFIMFSRLKLTFS